MLMLFAHRIGPDQYLDLALRTHKSLAWLSVSHPLSKIYGIDNCSRTYSPDPARFYCSFGPSGESCTGASTLPLRICRPPGKAATRRDAEPVFSDAYFTVWQLR